MLLMNLFINGVRLCCGIVILAECNDENDKKLNLFLAWLRDFATAVLREHCTSSDIVPWISRLGDELFHFSSSWERRILLVYSETRVFHRAVTGDCIKKRQYTFISPSPSVC